jgi:hypothetical protein
MVAGKAGAYPSEAPLFASLYGRLLALPKNIRPDWKNLQDTNNLALYANPYIMDKKF